MQAFCGIHRLKLSMCGAVCTFNPGALSQKASIRQHRTFQFQKYVLWSWKEKSKEGSWCSLKVFGKHQHRQLLLCSQKKKNKVTSEIYILGIFDLNKAPDLVVSTEEEDKDTQMLLIWFATGFRFIICMYISF